MLDCVGCVEGWEEVWKRMGRSLVGWVGWSAWGVVLMKGVERGTGYVQAGEMSGSSNGMYVTV